VKHHWNTLGDFSTALLDLLLPAVCPACQVAAGPTLCARCVAQLPLLINPCLWCGASRRPEQERCLSCDGSGLPHIDRVFVRYTYDGLMSQIVGLAKAAGRPAAVAGLAAVLASDLAESLPSVRAWAAIHELNNCCVTVVPPSRGRRPGPHLGTACARVVAREIAVPMRLLLRTRHLAAEQHRLSPAQRRANVADLFFVRAKVPAIVILVDDLLTTGATLSAAAAALRKAGAQRVVAVCLARTPQFTGVRGSHVPPTVTIPTAGIV
jgi:predicted amidophosphoribosyltransferase